jgi:circadian clock protein KaiB
MKQKEDDKQSKYQLRLFITGASPNSLRALTNLRDLCELHMPGGYDLEVIDVYQQPAIAMEQQVIALPMLLKMHPLPVKRLIGDMSNSDKVLTGLGLNM